MIINTGHLKSTDADKDPITYFMVNNTSNGNITVMMVHLFITRLMDLQVMIHLHTEPWTGKETEIYALS
jgi:hypothetical protein